MRNNNKFQSSNMLSITKIRGPLIMSLFPLQKYDKYIKPRSEPAGTPMERIKKIFVSTNTEPVSKELRGVITFTTGSCIVGMIIGGLFHTRDTVQKFIDNNEATRFFSHLDAKRELQTTFSMQYIKGAFKFGWRVALFSAIFESVRTLLTAYHGKPSVLHYIVGGGTAGFLFKMSLGIRGSLIGLIVGSILGTIGGSLILLILNLTGLSIEDIQSIEQEWARSKEALYKDAMAKQLEDEVEQTMSLFNANKEKQVLLSIEEEKVKNEVNKL